MFCFFNMVSIHLVFIRKHHHLAAVTKFAAMSYNLVINVTFYFRLSIHIEVEKQISNSMPVKKKKKTGLIRQWAWFIRSYRCSHCEKCSYNARVWLVITRAEASLTYSRLRDAYSGPQKLYGTQDFRKSWFLAKPWQIASNLKFQSVVPFATYTVIN